MQKIVDAIDTTPNHKKRLFTCLDRLNDALNDEIPSNQIIDILVMFCGFLFGFELDGRGSRTYSVEYWQNKEQYYTEKILHGANDYFDKKDVITIQRNIIEKLKTEGFDTFKIALIMHPLIFNNIGGYSGN
ncbi:MAG: hypothetical protein WCS92_02500 [Candidatus Babeliales bacterium]|jgi:hypothetical protein